MAQPPGKLYWRIKKNGKWTWKAVKSRPGRPSHLEHMIKNARPQEEE